MDNNGKVAQLGYWIAEPQWKKGYASETVGGVLEYGFNTLSLHEIFATVHVGNIASITVLNKNGMVKSGQAGNILTYTKHNDNIAETHT